MTDTAIQVENISKKYTIGGVKAKSLREALGVKFSNLISTSKTSEKPTDFWALQDISFSIKEGDIVGIIGKNGAGKSTLLKIISRITKPTSGRVEIYGRIASLLEVGTGFHPELTGRENIYLNGTILGMSRSEVAAKFDEIVEFSGVEKFIDTAVKRYSSGMTVRLAFAVAAHLEPEILIVDEVLAVGDAEFQKKCLGKMGEVSRKEGRTILFVSHSLPALKAICHSGILLEKGKMMLQSDIHEVIKTYSTNTIFTEGLVENVEYYDQSLMIVRDIIINNLRNPKFIQHEKVLYVTITMSFLKKTAFELDIHLKKDDYYIASYANYVTKEVTVFEAGDYTLDYEIQLPEMLSGYFDMDMYFTEPFIKRHSGIVNAIRFEMVNGDHIPYLNVQGMTWGKVLVSGTVNHRAGS